jgi:hypothetical protein
MAPEWRIVEGIGYDAVDNPVRLTDREILDELFEDLRKATAKGKHSYDIRFGEDGFVYAARVTIDREDPQVRENQVSVFIEREYIEGNVRVKVIDIEDLIVPAAATGVQKENAHHLFRTYWLYPEDIANKVATGEFHNLKEVDFVKLDIMRGEELSDDNSLVKRAKDDLDCIDQVSGLSGFEQSKIRVVECYYPWGNSQMIFQWIPGIKKLASWDYHSVRFGHGRRPFVLLPFIPIANRTYGIGIADMLDPLQQEAATIFNQMNDREDLVNNPVMLVEQNAGVNPNVFRALPPGAVVSVRNVERVRPLEWQKNPHSGLPIIQNLFAMSEQLAGVGDIQAGVQPNRPNAPRTARGTLALISEGNIILDTHIMLAQEKFKEVLHQIDGLLRQYMPPERQFPITGKQETGVVTRDNFRSSVKFYFSGNTVNTNIQAKQQTAQFLFQNLVGHPFFTGEFLQMPPLSIEATWRLLNYFAEQHLPGKDATFFFPQLEALLDFATQSQQAQAQAMEEGRETAAQSAQEQQQFAAQQSQEERALRLTEILAKFDSEKERSRVQESVARSRGSGSNSGSS